MIQSHMKNDKDISQLGMILQGIIEPHVNGGYRIYENTFITDDYPQGIRFISDNCSFETFFPKKSKLRVVQTKVIIFLKSMSERVGSDIERL